MSRILSLFCFYEQGIIRVFDVDTAASDTIPLAEIPIPITREGTKVTGTITKVGVGGSLNFDFPPKTASILLYSVSRIAIVSYLPLLTLPI